MAPGYHTILYNFPFSSGDNTSNMKNQLTLLMAMAMCLPCFAQQSSYPIETVGTPVSFTPVNAYTGWTNNGILTYSGTAEIQNINCSDNMSASGNGNVFFNNTPGINFNITGFTPSAVPTSPEITFNMFGYD